MSTSLMSLSMNSTWRLHYLIGFVWLAGSVLLLAQTGEVEAQDPSVRGVRYAPDKPMSGELEFVGSTLMQQMAALWVEEFRKVHPDVTAAIDCEGSEQSFPKLVTGKSVVGLVSRRVDDSEIASLSKELGAPLIALTVGYDVLAVIVHKDNPLDGLRWNARLGTPLSLKDDSLINQWSQLGLEPPLAEQPVSYHVISNAHALRSYADRILFAGKPVDSNQVHEYESPSELVAGVANDPAGIGLVSATRGPLKTVKQLAISVDAKQPILPTADDAAIRGYPLMRELVLLVVCDSNGKLDPLVEEFVAFALSRSGQSVLNRDGFMPLDASQMSAQHEKLGWELLK